MLRYTIEVTGRTKAGGRATIIESGRMDTNILLSNTSAPGQDRDFSFSGFGAFFNNGDTIANAALAGGTFSAIVHTNTHLAFQSSRSVVFRNVVSQVDNYIRYDSTDFSKGHQSIPDTDIKGIDISSEGYKRVNRVPLPDNNYSQEYAVINATGITDKNTDGTPVSNLSSISNVLGIFTNDGNVNLAPNKNYVSSGLSLEINAAIVAFNSSFANDGSRIEGSIVYTGGEKPDHGDRWKLVGSRVQSKINDIKYANRDIFFDVRFSGGKFAPPYFPGSTYDLGEAEIEGDVVISKIESPTPTSVSWYRDDN